MNDYEKLTSDINILREKLHEKLEQKCSLNCHEILCISKDMDKLLNRLYKFDILLYD